MATPDHIALDRLPWPPSNNMYYRHGRGRTYLSKAGTAYRDLVSVAVFEAGLHRHGLGPHYPDQRLFALLVFHPPDRGVHDLDNLLKAPLDAFRLAEIYGDDGQIDAIVVLRGDPEPPAGRLSMIVRPIMARDRTLAELWRTRK